MTYQQNQPNQTIINLKYSSNSAKMDKIANFINDIHMDSKTESIIKGELTPNIIYQKTIEFNALSVEDKQIYLMRLTQRLAKTKKLYKLLSILLLLDSLSNCNPRLTFPDAIVGDLQNDGKKPSLILLNIISYYHYFQKCNISNKFNIQTTNPEDELGEVLHFCQISVQKIRQFFKISFVFEQGILQLKQHKILVKQVLKSILHRFVSDLKILNIFVKNNVQIILQKTVKHPLALKINYVYEQLININKNLYKLYNFHKLIPMQLQYPTYSVDIDLNRQIEQAVRQNKESQSVYLDQSEKQSIGLDQDRIMMTTESFLAYDQTSYLI